MKNILLSESLTIIETLKKFNELSEKVLLVVDQRKRLLGTITDGDIRRYILKFGTFNSTITEIYNRNPIFLSKENYSLPLIKKILISKRIDLLPIVNKRHEVCDFITWDQAFADVKIKRKSRGKVRMPVVIMAGGEGTRLKPFTKVLPKPLIPIGDKTIIEQIIEDFHSQGVDKYYVTLNHKASLLETFLSNLNKNFVIRYIREKDYLGTAGSLKMLERKISGSFIVSNCDVIVHANYSNVIKFHHDNEDYLTILSAIQHHKIPYGVISFKKGGEVVSLAEKPEQTITINTGVYIINSKALKYIPADTMFHMTDLIECLLSKNKKVSTYLVNENDYVDVGQWDLYKEAIEKLSIFKAASYV